MRIKKSKHGPSRQPRIRGLSRVKSEAALLPSVREMFEEQAHVEGKSFSRVVAEYCSTKWRFDAATGERIKRNGHRKWGRNGKR